MPGEATPQGLPLTAFIDFGTTFDGMSATAALVHNALLINPDAVCA